MPGAGAGNVKLKKIIQMKKLVTIILLVFAFSVNSYAQDFTFHRISPAIVVGQISPFATVTKGLFTNTSTSTKSFKFVRILNNMPGPTWSSQLCVGTSCYPPEIDTVPPFGVDDVTLAPGTSDTLFIDIYGQTEGIASVVMKCYIKNAPTAYIVDTFKVQLVTSGIRNLSSVVKEYEMSQNYPNPFNPTTVIQFSLLSNQNVSLKIYNSLGVEVASLLNNENLSAGTYAYDFNANNYSLSSGIYFYRLRTDNFTDVKKMMLTK
jgi:hypothetical protein